MKTIAIVGGWAAGMMCAAKILEDSAENSAPVRIQLFEKNTVLGRKVSISGGGRCNVTTGITDRKTLLSKYTRGSEFFKRSLGKFGPKKVMEWFESHGVRLKCEEDLRVFPVSDDGAEVIWSFESMYRKYPDSIEVHFGASVKSVSKQGNVFMLHTDKSDFTSDVLVLTTGGNAYAHTGSSGDGYTLARELGHTITQLGPSLSSFETLEEFPKHLSGIAFERSTLVSADGKVRCEGPLLLTHFGISGPVAFTFSSNIAFETISKEHPFSFRLVPLAGWDMQAWDVHLERECRTHSGKLVANLLAFLLPKRFVEELGHSGLLPDIAKILEKNGATLSREERKGLARLLGEGIQLTIVQRRPGDEFVTAGGVNTAEVDDETLQSKVCPNLYLAGEVLDIDGVTGGFNLQVAWATGWNAGKSIMAE